MIIKYFLWNVGTRGRPLALKYHCGTRKMTIGGYVSDQAEAKNILLGYFELEKFGRPRHVQVNKFRYDVVMSEERFEYGVERMQKSGIQVTPTTSHGTVMR